MDTIINIPGGSPDTASENVEQKKYNIHNNKEQDENKACTQIYVCVSSRERKVE